MSKALTVTEKVQSLLKQSQSAIAAALPKHLNSDRFARIALTEFKKNPKLKECDPMSFIASVMTSAQLGLEPGPLGHCYLIPYKNQVQLQISYKGLIDLALRSGDILSISARVVYKNDKFEVKLGTEEKIVHEPNLDDPGEFKLVYAVATLKNGGKQFEIMTKTEVDKRRSMAQGDAIWSKFYTEMSVKCVIKKLIKYLPVSVELADAIEKDEKIPSQHKEEGDVFEVESSPVEALNAELSQS